MPEPMTPPIPEPSEQEMFLTRDFAAPPGVMWTFWTDPQVLARWFGPTGIHVDPEAVVVESRVGGRWDLDMVDDASGARYPVRSTIAALHEPDYFEGVSPADPDSGAPAGRLRLWLHEHGDATRLTIVQGPFTPEFRERTSAGWQLSFGKIDAILASS